MNFNCEHCCCIEKLNIKVNNPIVKTTGSVGIDFFSPQSINIPSQQSTVIFLNLKIKPPKGYFLQLKARSSLSVRNILVLGGTIDSDYSEDIGVILFNASQCSYQVTEGDRICQGIFLKYLVPEILMVNNIEKTNRGGFGSTGK